MENERKLNIELGESISTLRYFLKRFDIVTKKYKVFFRGKSFDFEGFRDYGGDEDVSSIDWKASTKAGKLLVRQYKEEDDKKIIFIVDTGENMVFGTTPKLKCEYAAEVVLSLADIALNNNDRVGLMTFNGKEINYSIPKRGKKTFDFYYSVLSDPKTYNGGSDISVALDYIIKNSDPHISVIVLVSDFINFDKKSIRNLELVSGKYETIAIIVKDPIDKTLPNISGELIIENPFSGEQLLIEPKLAKRVYEKNASKQEAFVKKTLSNAGVDFLNLSTSKPFAFDLTEFIQSRTKKANIATWK